MTTYTGDIFITTLNQAELEERLKNVEKVEGRIDLASGATLNAPALKTCERIYLSSRATLNAPNIKEGK